MKRIAPELESLMWTLAEEGNERAIDEFGGRHPELRNELLHRIAMVKGLRGEKKRTAEPIKTIPKFVPKSQKSYGPVYIVGALVLAAVAALAFVVTTLLTPPPHRPKEELPAVTVRTEPPVRAIQTPPRVDSTPPKLDTSSSGNSQTDTVLKPATLRIDHAPLLTVLELMSENCGVRIDPAPGMPNPDVSVDYQNMDAMDMLRDLGRQYSFTPLDQHDGSILVVPAIDPKDPSMRAGEVGGIRDQKIGG